MLKGSLERRRRGILVGRSFPPLIKRVISGVQEGDFGLEAPLVVHSSLSHKSDIGTHTCAAESSQSDSRVPAISLRHTLNSFKFPVDSFLRPSPRQPPSPTPTFPNFPTGPVPQSGPYPTPVGPTVGSFPKTSVVLLQTVSLARKGHLGTFPYICRTPEEPRGTHWSRLNPS